MPLQNRVAPDASLHTSSARGLLMGNRGRLHEPRGVLKRRRWASPHWIACALHYKNRHREAMGPGYTSLFFLDEVTALAAGHRPCCLCRRADALAFLNGIGAAAFDTALHVERQKHFEAWRDDLPAAAMVEHAGDFYAKYGRFWLKWSFNGYGPAAPLPSHKPLRLLTAPLIVEILRKGYQPLWHKTAFNEGDGR